MAAISSFMICESITSIQTSKGETIPQLIAPQSVLRPPFIPGSFSFGISVGVTGINFKPDNVARLTITSPDGKEVFNSGDITLGKIPEENRIPPEYQGFLLTTDLRNLVLPQEGMYIAEIMLNSESVGKQAFPVYKKGE